MKITDKVIKNIYKDIQPFIYGCYDKTTDSYIADLNRHRDDIPGYIVQMPDVLVKSKTGTCYDVALYTYAKLKQLKAEPCCIFYMREECRSTHITTVAKSDNEFVIVDLLHNEFNGKHLPDMDTVLTMIQQDILDGDKVVAISKPLTDVCDKMLGLGEKLTYRKFLELVQSKTYLVKNR